MLCLNKYWPSALCKLMNGTIRFLMNWSRYIFWFNAMPLVTKIGLRDPFFGKGQPHDWFRLEFSDGQSTVAAVKIVGSVDWTVCQGKIRPSSIMHCLCKIFKNLKLFAFIIEIFTPMTIAVSIETSSRIQL